MKFTDHYEGHIIVREDGALFEKITVEDQGRYAASAEILLWTPKIQKAQFFSRISEAMRMLGKVQKLEQGGKTQPLPVSIKYAKMDLSAEITEPDSALARGSGQGAS